MNTLKYQLWAVYALVGIALLYTGFKFFEARPGDMRLVVRGETAYAYGTTRYQSLGYVKQVLRDNPQIEHIVLRNMPGTQDADTNIVIARLLRDKGISTHLERRSRIASGAVDLFIAGKERTMECGAKIGVHAWSSGHINPREMARDPRQTYHEGFLADMGVDPHFYVFTREAAPPESLHFLTTEEIERYRLLTQDANCD